MSWSTLLIAFCVGVDSGFAELEADMPRLATSVSLRHPWAP
jgi:hypothetical protein